MEGNDNGRRLRYFFSNLERNLCKVCLARNGSRSETPSYSPISESYVFRQTAGRTRTLGVEDFEVARSTSPRRQSRSILMGNQPFILYNEFLEHFAREPLCNDELNSCLNVARETFDCSHFLRRGSNSELHLSTWI